MGKMSIVFFYFMKPGIANMKSVVEDHKNYWHGVNISAYEGGPFLDKTGGLIRFQAESYDQAMGIINKDPFVINDCLDKKWVKQWLN